MRKKLPVLILALIILLQAFVPAVYAISENEAISSTVSFCSLDTTLEGAGKTIDDTVPIGGKITGYTKHGLNQAIGRDGGKGVASKAILDAVKNSLKIVAQEGKYGTTYKYMGKDAVVVLNKAGEVVTTYAKGSAGLRGGR